MFAVVVVESSMSSAVIDARRAREGWARPFVTSGNKFENKMAAVASADAWPRYRTDPGTQFFTYNEALLSRGEGPQYYSSYTTKETFDALNGLGFPWVNYGRTILGQDNPVIDAIFAIGARVNATNKSETRFTADRFATPPLVTVRPPTAPAAAPDTVFARQEALLGTKVYAVPPVTMAGAQTAAAVVGDGPYKITWKENVELRFTATCAPGSEVYWYSPQAALTASQGSVSRVSTGSHDGYSAGGVLPLGPVPATGRVEVVATPAEDGEIPRSPIGCLDRSKVQSAVTALTATGATKVTVDGSSINAVLPKGSTGTAVISTAASDGWQCSQQGGSMREPDNLYGLLAVPLKAGSTRISCSYTPPGLFAGLAGGGLAAACLVAVAVTVWLRERKSPRPHRRPGRTRLSGRWL